ncbi:tyrosine-type recombinase/integrase [Sorangium sp. So ce381]|uniref:tyrosine-type recombinase/integrase n=1 Tax=Sorangium sp. So ce381 TaxID=3133307 RepID=UPI003F5B34F4
MNARPTLAKLLESFFRRRLVEQRNASPATVASYRDALRLLVRYAAERTKREPCALAVTDFDRDLILDFLDQLERVRGNQAQTRNARLTAIRSFFRHVAATDPASIGIAQRILAIPAKRTTSATPRHLAEDELAALLNASDPKTVQGRRDHALLLFLARTGARVSEAIGIDAADLRLEPPQQVLLRGKGRKQRRVPLAADLAQTLRALCRERGLGFDERRPVFIGEGGERLTRFGVTHLVRRVVERATVNAPTLAGTRVSPHLFRHTLAMQLLRARTDLVTIQAWLGHAQVATTHRYAEADVEMMRKSLREAKVTGGCADRYQPTDEVLQILENV